MSKERIFDVIYIKVNSVYVLSYTPQYTWHLSPVTGAVMNVCVAEYEMYDSAIKQACHQVSCGWPQTD